MASQQVTIVGVMTTADGQTSNVIINGVATTGGKPGGPVDPGYGVPEHPADPGYFPPHPAHPIVLPDPPTEGPPEGPPTTPQDPQWVWGWSGGRWRPTYVPGEGEATPKSA